MNPELTRNLWLEVTPHRLLLMPAVIFASAALLHTSDPSNTIVRSLSLLGFMLFTLVWGARLAANSVLDEAREHTWDIQRMSALSPWSMTWGKLAGATAMAWYGGGWCLLVYLAAGDGADFALRLRTAALTAILAIMAQGGALIGALVGLHRGHRVQARLSNVLSVVLLITVVPRAFSLPDTKATIAWYGASWDGLDFSLLAAAVYAGWALLGAARAMNMELQVRTRPVSWLAFALCTAVFVTGFAADGPALSGTALGTLFSALTIVALVQAYTAAFAYPGDTVEWRRVLRALATGGRSRLLEVLPLWTSALALAIVAGIVTTLQDGNPHFSTDRLDHVNLGASALALALMGLRDLALLAFFSLRRRGRAEATALVYIAILDGLLPALLPGFGLDGLVGLVRPAFFIAPLGACVVMAIHAAITIALAVAAYQASTASLSARTPLAL